jgi:hypothetical protein
MSDESVDQQIQPNKTQQSTTGDTKDTQVNRTSEDHAKILSELSAENKKYRQSYVQYKRELDEANERLQKMQESTLAEQGKFKDLYEQSSKALSTEREQRMKDRAQWTGTVVASRFAAEAAKAGCQDPMALIKIANADGLLSTPDLVSEDTFEVNQEALSAIVQQSKKQYQILFGKATPAPKDGVPKTNSAQPIQHDLSKMKTEDLIALAKASYS